MTLKRRLMVAGFSACLALTAVLTAKRYSVPMIAYVVEEAVIQKLPAGEDPSLIRARFRGLISRIPDRQVRLEKLLSMSQYLERLQMLEPQELERLLSTNEPGALRDRI
jgi:hypothetical protein